MQIERWLPIPEFPSYEVSDMGNVRRISVKCKLSLSNVEEARRLRSEGMFYHDIARRFGVIAPAIQYALNHKPKRTPARVPYRLLKAQRHNRGYLFVNLCENGVSTIRLIHVLVALAFLGKPPEGYEVNHKNANKSDPRLDNLEYVTRAENMLHYHRVTKRRLR